MIPTATPRSASIASIAAAMALPAALAAAAGETVTVTTLEDVTDFGGARQVEDLPGPDGLVSFREACDAVNNTAGPQTIGFAIPRSEWWLGDDMALLRLEDGAFHVTGDETTLDFTTQTDFTGDTNPNGGEVGIYGLQANGWGIAAIFIHADDCVIKGLDRVLQRGFGLEIRGDHNRVIANTISGSLYAGVKVQGNVGDPATGNIIGGTEPGVGNVLSGGNSGVRIDGPTEGTVVIGNTIVGSPYAGIEVRGAYCCPEYTPHDTRIGGPTEAERNWIADNGSYGEEGFPQGDQVAIEWAVATVVEGNYIGTTEDGAAAIPGAHGVAGVSVRESEGTAIRDNVISGMKKIGVNHAAGQVFGAGISILGPNTGVVITGNRIGSDAAGRSPVPNLNGISFSWFQGYASGARIGGPNAGEPNLVAFNERNGIIVANGIEGVTIDRNAIHANAALGIDLLPQSGPTPNDAGDGDAGGNGLQNHPVLDSAESFGSSITIAGHLNSSPDAAFMVQFFASETCHPSGSGEGAVFLGETPVTTDASGDAAILASFDVAVPAGQVVTATATRAATGSTSEFSGCIAVAGGLVVGDLDRDGVVGLADLLALLADWGPCEDRCPADLDGSGAVGLGDLLIVLASWS